MKKIIPLLMASFLLAICIPTQAQRLAIKIINTVNPTCSYDSNGSANVVVSGGVAPYTYLWEPSGQTTDSATGLFASIQYSLTVTDAVFDTVIGNVTLSSASTLTTSTSSADVSCFGLFNGMVTVIPTGGLLPYQYLWQPVAQTTDTANALAAGTYTSTVTDGAGCVAQTTALVAQPAALNVTAFTYASAASATATGGTMPYTYLWYPIGKTTPSVSGLAPGTYTVTITDANVCTNSVVVTVPMYIAPELLLIIGPPTMTCGNPGYITYPIIAQGNSTIFNNCAIGINYPTSEFLGDSVSNGGVMVTQGADFMPGLGNDYDSLNVENVADDVIEIRFGSPVDSSPNGTLLSADDTLLYVKFKIQSCQAANVSFINNSYNDTLAGFEGKDSIYVRMDSILNFISSTHDCNPYPCNMHTCNWYCCQYQNSSCVDSCYSICFDTCYETCYDTTWYYTTHPIYYVFSQVMPYSPTLYANNTYYGETCPLQITDFNSPINAGVGDILTITGTGFGNPRGTGQVEFRDADSAHYTTLKLNDIDYIGWTNNEIKIRLPAYADTAVPGHPANEMVTGGGRFAVVNSCGESVTSGYNASHDTFSVYFNIMQYWNQYETPNQKTEILLRGRDSATQGYIIQFDSITFPKDSMRRRIFMKAMKDWTCYIGMNWTVGPDISFTYTTGHFNGVNYVLFTPPGFLPPGEVAQTDPDPEECSNYTDILQDGVFCFSSDTSTHFIYDTLETIAIPRGWEDFYGVCLHEQGHFIGLNHTTGKGDLMYWTANSGPLAAANRLTLASAGSGGAIAGGMYSVFQSENVPSLCFNAPTMTGKGTSCINDYTGIKIIKDNGIFVIYPNPSNGTFTIDAPVNEYTIVITNILGQQILSRKIENQNEVINISTVANGMYFIQEQYKNGIATQKLIITKR